VQAKLEVLWKCVSGERAFFVKDKFVQIK
jgi:hypothetical protein